MLVVKTSTILEKMHEGPCIIDVNSEDRRHPLRVWSWSNEMQLVSSDMITDGYYKRGKFRMSEAGLGRANRQRYHISGLHPAERHAS